MSKKKDRSLMRGVGIHVIDLFDHKMANFAHIAATSLRELAREVALKGQGSPGSVGYSIHKAALNGKARSATADLHKLGVVLPYSKYKMDALNQSGTLARAIDLDLPLPSAETLRAQAKQWDDAADAWEAE